MRTIDELRQEMDVLMRERGIRTLADFDRMAFGGSAPATADVVDPRPFFTGYSYGRLYDWDQYFEAIVQLYAGWETTCIRHSLMMFLDSMHASGHIERTLPRVWWGHDMVKPFLVQQALLLFQRPDEDLSWFFPEYYYRLKHYLQHWLFAHDVRGAGLSVWDSAGHSGMDNHFERAGYFYDAYCEGVDLNAYLVRECEAFALLAEHYGHPTEAEDFRGYAQQRRDAINRWCWNEAEGIYYDYHAKRHQPISVKYVGTFAALWARVATAAQAERLVREHLLNPEEFWRPHPLPALAASEPGYVSGHLPSENLGCCSWRAHTWIPANYFTFQGLRAYGFTELAGTVAATTAALFRRHPFREYYLTESGEPCGCDPFWGWSSLALYMEEEHASGFDPTRLTLDRVCTTAV